MGRGVLRWVAAVGLLGLIALASGWRNEWFRIGGRQDPVQPLKTLIIGHHPTGIAVDESASRAAVINAGDNSVSIVDTRDGTIMTTVDMGYRSQFPLAVAMDSRTGYTFIAGPGTRGPGLSLVSILDTRRGHITRSVTIPGAVRGIAVDERTERVFILNDAATSRRSNVTILDAKNGSVLRTVVVGTYPVGIAVDRRVGRVLIVNQGAALVKGIGTVGVLDARSGAILRIVAVGQRPMAVAVDESTGRAFVTNNGGSVSVLDTMHARLVTTINVDPQPDAVGVDLTSHHVFVTALGTNHVVMLDARANRVLRIVPVGIRPMAVAVDTHAHRAFIVNDVGGTVTVLNSVTGAVIDTVAVGQDPIDAIVDKRTKHAFIVSVGADNMQPTFWDHFACRIRELAGKGCPSLASRALSGPGSVSVLDTSR